MGLAASKRIGRAVGPILAMSASLLAAPAALSATPDAKALATATAPFTARFNVDKAGLPLGDTRFTLARDASKPSCFVYRGQAHPNALAGLFLGDIDERSRFCIVDGEIRPMRFSHSEKGEANKSYTLIFDWPAGKARYTDKAGRHRTFDITPGVQDPLSLQIAARAWVAGASDSASGEQGFPLVDDDGVKTFKLTRAPANAVKTPAGRYDVLKVARADSPDHTLELWLAKGERFIPVQVTTGKDGRVFTMKATALSFQD